MGVGLIDNQSLLFRGLVARDALGTSSSSSLNLSCTQSLLQG